MRKQIWRIYLPFTKAKTKYNLQILICNRFRADGTCSFDLRHHVLTGENRKLSDKFRIIQEMSDMLLPCNYCALVSLRKLQASYKVMDSRRNAQVGVRPFGSVPFSLAQPRSLTLHTLDCTELTEIVAAFVLGAKWETSWYTCQVDPLLVHGFPAPLVHGASGRECRIPHGVTT